MVMQRESKTPDKKLIKKKLQKAPYLMPFGIIYALTIERQSIA